jgi:hypothetical protein
MTTTESIQSYERAQFAYDRQEQPEPVDEDARMNRELDAADHDADIRKNDL